MGQESYDKFWCDSCDFELWLSEEEVMVFQPDGWISVTRFFEPEDEGEFDHDRHVVSKIYCSQDCLQDSLEWGDLDQPEPE